MRGGMRCGDEGSEGHVLTISTFNIIAIYMYAHLSTLITMYYIMQLVINLSLPPTFQFVHTTETRACGWPACPSQGP